MKEIYKNVLDKATLPKESKENLKSLYDKVVEGLSDKKSVPDYKTMC